MNRLFGKISSVFVIVVLLNVCGVSFANASDDYKYILMEAKLGKRDMRSTMPIELSVNVEVIGGGVAITFFNEMNEAIINLRNEQYTPVYSNGVSQKRIVFIPTSQLGSGCYFLEINAANQVYSQLLYIDSASGK